ALLQRELARIGVRQLNELFFDTLRLEPPSGAVERVRQAALDAGFNFRYRADGTVNVALDETTDLDDVEAIVRVFATAAGGDQRQTIDRSQTGLTIEYANGLART